MRIRVGRESALVVMQPQNDFFPGGSVPVPGAEKIVTRLDRYVEHFYRRGSLIVVVRDWHPWDHRSFFANGGDWMRHCVQNEYGAQIHPDLRLPVTAAVVSLGVTADHEPDSMFDGTLFKPRARRLFFCGLEPGRVLFRSALEARLLDYEVFVLKDAFRTRKRWSAQISTLQRTGVRFVTAWDFEGMKRDPVRSRH